MHSPATHLWSRLPRPSMSSYNEKVDKLKAAAKRHKGRPTQVVVANDMASSCRGPRRPSPSLLTAEPPGLGLASSATPSLAPKDQDTPCPPSTPPHKCVNFSVVHVFWPIQISSPNSKLLFSKRGSARLYVTWQCLFLWQRPNKLLWRTKRDGSKNLTAPFILCTLSSTLENV